MSSARNLPHVDFSVQWDMEDCIHTEAVLWDGACRIATRSYMDTEYFSGGVIVVVGTFGRIVEGMVRMGENPVQSYIRLDKDNVIEIIEKYAYGFDGAIVIHETGQVLGAGIYLEVENPMLYLPNGCGTRHKAAASFSLRNNVSGVLTISEETQIVRFWQDGKVTREFDVAKGGRHDE